MEYRNACTAIPSDLFLKLTPLAGIQMTFYRM